MRSKILFFLLMSSFLAVSAQATEVRLSVALSLTDAVKALIAAYPPHAQDVTFLPNFASSGALAKQIAQGASADLFISANPKWMNYLVDEKFIAAEQTRTFVANSLVFVGDKNLKISAMNDLATLSRIAIGSPKSTPVGHYAEQALIAAGLGGQVQGKLVLAKDVRQALAYADQGEVDGAFVYKTDALLAQHAVILLEIPQHYYPEVVYPLCLTNEGLKNPAARAFAEFLASAEASAILQRYGFIVK